MIAPLLPDERWGKRGNGAIANPILALIKEKASFEYNMPTPPNSSLSGTIDLTKQNGVKCNYGSGEPRDDGITQRRFRRRSSNQFGWRSLF